MKPLDRKTAAKLARLAPALEARTGGAAASYKKAMEKIEAIDAKMAELRVETAEAAGRLDPSDLAAFAAYGPWAEAQRRRIKQLLEQRLEKEAEAEALREELARAHGEAQALDWLLKRAAKG